MATIAEQLKKLEAIGAKLKELYTTAPERLHPRIILTDGGLRQWNRYKKEQERRDRQAAQLSARHKRLVETIGRRIERKRARRKTTK